MYYRYLYFTIAIMFYTNQKFFIFGSSTLNFSFYGCDLLSFFDFLIFITANPHESKKDYMLETTTQPLIFEEKSAV